VRRGAGTRALRHARACWRCRVGADAPYAPTWPAQRAGLRAQEGGGEEDDCGH
jgi:hypothetical protein